MRYLVVVDKFIHSAEASDELTAARVAVGTLLLVGRQIDLGQPIYVGRVPFLNRASDLVERHDAAELVRRKPSRFYTYEDLLEGMTPETLREMAVPPSN